MSTFIPLVREIRRCSMRIARYNRSSRGFNAYSRVLAGQNFTMPAMSPTMTEGNIAAWKVKEGDTFSTGDVLLEIETDKAQMDVEAQDDGKMAKITEGDGAKAVKVGTRIAVLAEIDDDLSTLPIPAEPETSSASPQENMKSSSDHKSSSEPQAEAPQASKGEDTPPHPPSASIPSSKSQPGQASKQTYPLYPSISQLLHEKGIPSSEADKIPASGPKGRLLKGDVLAYLGTINASYSHDQSLRITNLGHLDLSYIKVTSPASTSAPSKEPVAQQALEEVIQEELPTEIAVSISLKSVLEVQSRVQNALGVTLPLSTFIARATELANDELPRPKDYKPTPDELFNQVLGLDKVSSTSSRGGYIPQITALPSANTPLPSRPANRAATKEADIIDMLSGSSSSSNVGINGLKSTAPPTGIMAGATAGALTNVFSVSVPKGEEKRARVFLERIKTILQVEPGKLVL